jgi:hypothetical protein
MSELLAKLLEGTRVLTGKQPGKNVTEPSHVNRFAEIAPERLREIRDAELGGGQTPTGR